MKMCLACCQPKEVFPSIYACEDCCKGTVRNISSEVTGRELIHALQTLGKTCLLIEAKTMTVV